MVLYIGIDLPSVVSSNNDNNNNNLASKQSSNSSSAASEMSESVYRFAIRDGWQLPFKLPSCNNHLPPAQTFRYLSNSMVETVRRSPRFEDTFALGQGRIADGEVSLSLPPSTLFARRVDQGLDGTVHISESTRHGASPLITCWQVH